jgi:hypothetical protein
MVNLRPQSVEAAHVGNNAHPNAVIAAALRSGEAFRHRHHLAWPPREASAATQRGHLSA